MRFSNHLHGNQWFFESEGDVVEIDVIDEIDLQLFQCLWWKFRVKIATRRLEFQPSVTVTTACLLPSSQPVPSTLSFGWADDDKCMGICYWSFRKLFVRTRSTLIVSNLNAMKKTEWLTDFNHDEKALLASWLSILDLRRNCYSSDSSVFRSWSLLLCYSESESSTSICLENHLDMYW